MMGNDSVEETVKNNYDLIDNKSKEVSPSQ